MVRSTVFAATVAATLSAAWAAPTASHIRAEIDGLLARMEASSCRFERNGSWHTPAEAKAHMLRKLAAVERRGSLSSTEQFIDVAATRSSTSGRAYAVQCGTSASEPSAAWMRRELLALRHR
jgi:Family of unknown function (DUF5329)